jgi:pilus assembly protein CpaE
MPDNTTYATEILGTAQDITSTIIPPPKRQKFAGFVSDQDSAMLLHDVLGPNLPEGNHFHVVSFRQALNILSGMKTPETILVDLSGEEQPINALLDLADAVDQGTTVIGIGSVHNVSFYRTVTKGMGIKEYLPKPLSRESIEKHFVPLITKSLGAAAGTRGGRLITIAGARGGVGASTIASNLAWMIGSEMHRHTVLLDADLYAGTLALNLDMPAGKGLSQAIQSPDRVDHLLLERATQPAADRLHLLSALEEFEHHIDYDHQGAVSLAEALRSRYNFVLADAGSKLSPFGRDLLYLAHQRVIVLDPSVISVRNVERLSTLPGGPLQSPRAMLVLNKANTPGGLTQEYMEQVLGVRFDAVIPDLPRIIPKATEFGTIAASLRGPFRTAMAELAATLGATALAEAA